MQRACEGPEWPSLLVAVTSGFFIEGTWLRATLYALRRWWRLWLVYLTLAAGYVVVYGSTLTSSDLAGAAWFVQRCLRLRTHPRDAFIPGFLGGPWRWYRRRSSPPQASPPAALARASWVIVPRSSSSASSTAQSLACVGDSGGLGGCGGHGARRSRLGLASVLPALDRAMCADARQVCDLGRDWPSVRSPLALGLAFLLPGRAGASSHRHGMALRPPPRFVVAVIGCCVSITRACRQAIGSAVSLLQPPDDPDAAARLAEAVRGDWHELPASCGGSARTGP